MILDSIDRTMVDAEDASGKTLLSWAAEKDDVNTVSRLLAAGANPNKVDKGGRTPLHFAAQTLDSNGCVAQLIAAKAHIEMKDWKGQYPCFGCPVVAKEINGRSFFA